MRGLVLCLGVSVLLWSTPSTTRAAFLVHDWKTPGDGLLTYDEQTELEWLDWTVTQGMSFGQVVASDEYQGFRHATFADVIDLMGRIGFTNYDPVLLWFSQVDANYQPAVDFQSLFGITEPNVSFRDLSYGVISDNPDPLRAGYRSVMGAMSEHVGVGHGWGGWARASWTDSVAGTYVGHALVRDVAAVPEPANFTVCSMLAGIAFTYIWQRKRRMAQKTIRTTFL